MLMTCYRNKKMNIQIRWPLLRAENVETKWELKRMHIGLVAYQKGPSDSILLISSSFNIFIVDLNRKKMMQLLNNIEFASFLSYEDKNEVWIWMKLECFFPHWSTYWLLPSILIRYRIDNNFRSFFIPIQ